MHKATTLAVITGEHSFDVPNLYRLIRALEGIDAYVQDLEHFAPSPDSTRDAYVAIFISASKNAFNTPPPVHRGLLVHLLQPPGKGSGVL
jgi:hypothetical protein